MKIKTLLEQSTPEERASIEEILEFAVTESIDDYESLLEWDADELDEYISRAFPIEY